MLLLSDLSGRQAHNAHGTEGGHGFDLKMDQGEGTINKISRIQIELPTTPAFDTYSLKEASQDEIEEVEQGKG